MDLTAESDLDTIFAEVGEFGIYQIAIYMLICIPNALSATFVVNYMFTANTLDYRWVFDYKCVYDNESGNEITRNCAINRVWHMI